MPGTETDDAVPPRHALRESLAWFALIALMTGLLSHAPEWLPGLRSYVHLLVGLLFLTVAIRVARREPSGMKRHGISLAGVLEPADADDDRSPGPLGLYDLFRALKEAAPVAALESGVGLAVAALIFPPFILGFWWWHAPVEGFELRGPDDLIGFTLTQLLVVALPEEAFFRGTLQTRLQDHWAAERSLFGVRLSVRAWLLSAALFALVHFVSIPDPARLAVFFPALLFGLLRAWRGGIGAAILLHALSNLLSEVLQRSWGLAG